MVRPMVILSPTSSALDWTRRPLTIAAVGAVHVGQLVALARALQAAVLAGHRVVLQLDVVFGQLADDHRVLGQVKDLALVVGQVF